MTPTVQIGQFRARYCLPAPDEKLTRRLNAALARVLGEPLERALEWAGINPAEQICIRSLHAPLRLPAHASDAVMEAAWTDALVTAIRRAAPAHQAPLASRGRRQTGAPDAELAAPQLESVTPAEVETPPDRSARPEGSPDPDAEPTVARYRSLQAALQEMALAVAAGDLARRWAWRQLGLWAGDDQDENSREAARQLLRALLAHPASIVPIIALLARRRLLGQWAHSLLAAEWHQLAARALGEGHGSAETLLAVIEQQLGACPEKFEHALPPGWRPLTARLASLAPQYADALRRDAAQFALLALDEDPALRRLLPLLNMATDRATDMMTAPASPHSAFAPELEEPFDVQGETSFGGLLFLLNVLERSGLAADIIADPRLHRRSMRWVLHQLAQLLVGCEPTDPAALAFAGQLPGSAPPSVGEGLPEPEEVPVLAAWSDQLQLALAQAMGDEAASEHWLASVTERFARIDGDPGWLEARFSLRDVSIDLRRAGLDVDPGWLAWLGCVVRFVYE